ncbi:hypothetical protein [Desulfosporosinus sp. Sb-LF]|uniref:hypothetical protein n=1 Tax=Desulfosporosinus sp. Sb-LF TaxID=2560027 RepID=UPI00107FC7F7|nr:hypothetical protein [Desulfosporosinus sp. Sb-LF]TGE32474.1 hypothetical protein E4K68_12855 [Desulfosporosinus sp. Sb-LF]
MLNIRRQIDRERIAGAIIFISLFVILLSMVGIRFLDVKVSNIEFVDRGLYTIITDQGPINIDKDNVLRIERTYAKAAITGTSVELDRVYTTKGFIYFSSLDPFYNIGHKLINSLDFQGKPIWIRTNNNSTESNATSNQLLNANLRLIQPFNYAIGTPSKLSSIVFFVLSLQYLALAIGGMALMILIFPLRLDTATIEQPPISQQESEYRSAEEQLGAVAK